MISVPDYKEICAASDAFLHYLVEHYRDRMEEPLPFDRHPLLALAACQDASGEWSVCMPLDLGDDEVVESVALADEGIKTRGDLISYMNSGDWTEVIRWVSGVDEHGNLLPVEEVDE